MKIHLPCDGNRFPRIVVEDNTHLMSDALEPYVEAAVELADACQSPVHIQTTGEITHSIIYPEAA